MEGTKAIDVKVGTGLLSSFIAVWGLGVAAAAHAGLIMAMQPIYYGPLVALGIAVPFAIYLWTPAVKRYFDYVGVYPLTVLHVWRIPASLAFFWYGFQDQLPPAFWILAGVGDFLAGVKALPLLKGPASDETYFRIHRFGFADFVVAVGTGLLFTVLNDPRMVTIRELPMILIPLFGVGISGASHLIAFDMLRRRRNAAAQDQSPRIYPAE
jgi:hypothetical protein